MKIVVDTNIFFSGLLKPDSAIADFLLQPGPHQLFSPQFLKAEISGKVDRLSGISGLTPELVQSSFLLLTRNIKFIETDTLDEKILEKAYQLVKDIDPFDFPVVALTMYLKKFVFAYRG